jgi:hypothetical protein
MTVQQRSDKEAVRIQRTFSKLQSSSLFNQVQHGQEAALTPAIASQGKKKYVIVEESRREELTKMENTLRTEKELIGESGAWVLSDFQFDARTPVPAVRQAVASLCTQQMERVANDLRALVTQWSRFAKQNHYDKPHLFIEKSYLECAPLAQRALKLRMVRDAADAWRLRKDRDTTTCPT